VIPAIKLGPEAIRISRASHHRVEINHRIKRAARTYPLVHALANSVAAFRVVRCALKGQQCAADHFDSVRVRPLDHLTVRADEIVCRRVFARRGIGSRPKDKDFADACLWSARTPSAPKRAFSKD
jgi:hypothetical protein